jgi:hypothetical protein
MTEYETEGIEPGGEIEGAGESVAVPPSPEPDQYADAPQSWQREIAERHWRGLPGDLRGYVHSREKQSHEHISKLGQELRQAQEAAQRFQKLTGVFDEWKPYLPEGVTHDAAIQHLLAAQRMFAEQPQEAVRMFMQDAGIDPVSLLPDEYRSHVEGLQRQLHEMQAADVQKTVDSFTKDKPYYEEIRQDVIQEILALRKQAPGLDHATVMQLAHDRVVERSGLKTRLEAQRKAEETAKQLAEAAEAAKKQREDNARHVKAARRAASINVRSTPVNVRPARTLDDDLRDIAHRHYSR